jgi:phage terminase large subunit-like protein
MVAAPLLLTPVPPEDAARGDGEDFADFTEAMCRITKDSVGGRAGELITLRRWQRRVTSMLLARRPDGRRRHRTALIGLPRKNGKSAIGSALGLHGLVMDGQGAEVYSCAADKEQARIVFGVARRMVELDPELSSVIRIYRDALEHPASGSVYRVLSSEAFTKEGLSPTRVIYDELHAAPDRELYDVMSLAMGARSDPLLLAITTAGVKSDRSGGDSVCYGLWQYGCKVASGELDDPSFFMAWWGAPDDAPHAEPEVWRDANPGFADIVDGEDFASAVLRTPENEFRTKRLNQWVSSAQAWLPGGSWESREDGSRVIEDGAAVVLGFDGSKTGDNTGIVVATCELAPHVDVAGLWERPPDAVHWEVPRGEVKAALRACCKRWDVREIAYDPYLWIDAMEELEGEGLPVVEFPQQNSAMIPATQRFYELVVTGGLTHSGDPRMARHLANAVMKTDSRGSRIVKDAPHSPRKIDLAVAAVMAVERAMWHAGQTVNWSDTVWLSLRA